MNPLRLARVGRGVRPVLRSPIALAELRRATIVVVTVLVTVAAVVSCAASPAKPAKPAKPARPLTFVVAPNGSDRTRGTEKRPWRTIGHALAVAPPGAVILVKAGTYRETIDDERSGTAEHRIVLRAYPRARPTIEGSLALHGSYVTIRGFRIQGVADAGPAVGVWIEGSYVSLTGCEVTASTMSGVLVGKTVGVRIVGDWIHDNGTHVVNQVPQDHGIYWSDGVGGLIANNIVDNNLGYGIHLYPNASQTLVTSNTVVRNGRLVDGSQGASGVILGGAGTASNTVADNIIAFNSEFAVRSLDPLGASNLVIGNLGYGNYKGDFPETPPFGDGLSFDSNFVAAPHFVDPRAGDFHLKRSSPAYGRSLANYSPQKDYAGVNRFGAHGPDLGAFQVGP